MVVVPWQSLSCADDDGGGGGDGEVVGDVPAGMEVQPV